MEQFILLGYAFLGLMAFFFVVSVIAIIIVKPKREGFYLHKGENLTEEQQIFNNLLTRYLIVQSELRARK